MSMDTKIRLIGFVRSEYKERGECPKQPDPNAPEANIKILDHYLPGLYTLQPGSEILVLTWLHQGDRSVLQCHPRGNPENPLRGVFATRAPDRPNPIGLHQVKVLEIRDNHLRVQNMEVIDGTPVLDIKPVIGEGVSLSMAGVPGEESEKIIQIGEALCRKGLLNGFNGNISVRTGDNLLITGTGSAKGYLTDQDMALMDISTGRHEKGANPSSESRLHCAVYEAQPKAKAIVHTHPPHLLALSLKRPGQELLFTLPLFEADFFRRKIGLVPPLPPGSEELARAAGEAARTHESVFMQRHGLVCWGDDLVQAAALSEEIDSLAAIELLHLS